MKVVTGAIVVLTLVAGTSLNAATITETITGTLAAGIDNAAIFGPQGANLAGKTATITYILNSSVLAMDGLYASNPPTLEQLTSFANDGALTNIITVGGTTFTQTQSAGTEEEFSTTKLGTGSEVMSTLFNSGTGLGSSITIQSNAPYQFGVLLGNPKPFLDQVTAGATQVMVGIDTFNGSFGFQTDLTLIPVATPEPSSFVLLIATGLLLTTVRCVLGHSARAAQPSPSVAERGI
jgi:hypothetical protein